MRNLLILFTVMVMTLTAASVALSLEGNGRKGKYLYRKNCRTCHGASASDLSPMSKVQTAWKACYTDLSTLPCYDEWKDKMSPGDVTDIFTYLHDFAADSPTPAKCS